MDKMKEIKENIEYLEGILQTFSNKTQNRPYLNPAHMRKLKREVIRVEREKKLERIFK